MLLRVLGMPEVVGEMPAAASSRTPGTVAAVKRLLRGRVGNDHDSVCAQGCCSERVGQGVGVL